MFLMKARYYEENLDITPPKNAIVKDMKQEAYKRIEELKNVINGQKVEQKEKDRRIKILEDLKKE